ncbi:hypothetical protein [Paenibacillus uliginis]|uniref:hypothetical protein n=1 Tax=Paenibacillus uliginis TaxID=683737 RepID=UPI001AD8083A|nr:hypothetical protein [Paenibacillus uliginis]
MNRTPIRSFITPKSLVPWCIYLTIKMTIIVIAHRLSTIRHTDQVIVMEQGRVIKQGATRLI